MAKLALANTTIRNKGVQSEKARNWANIPADLRVIFDALCNGSRKWPLFLHGRVGTGKSCAGLCLADRVKGAEFWTMPKLVAHVADIKAGRAEWYDCGRGGVWTAKGWWQYIAKVPLLILDDIGLKEIDDDDVLFQALEERAENPLVCTSNLSPKDIEDSYNARIYSRLCSATTHELRGRDRRFAQPEDIDDIAD